MKQLFNHRLLDLFHQLPEPHKSNCINSIPKGDNRIAPTLSTGILMMDWNCGFAPHEYYENLYHAIISGKIQLKEHYVNYYDPIRN